MILTVPGTDDLLGRTRRDPSPRGSARLDRHSHDHALSAEPAAFLPRLSTPRATYRALLYGIAAEAPVFEDALAGLAAWLWQRSDLSGAESAMASHHLISAPRRTGDLPRREVDRENEGGTVEVEVSRSIGIKSLSPFRLDFTVWALRRRPRNTIDRWDGASYQRALALTHGAAVFSVTQTLQDDWMGNAVKEDVRASIERILGVQVDLSGFYPWPGTTRCLDPSSSASEA